MGELEGNMNKIFTRERVIYIVSQFLFITVILSLVHFLVINGIISKFTIPPVDLLFMDFVSLPFNTSIPKGFFHHLYSTIQAILLGIFFMFITVFPTSFILAFYKKLRQIFEPILLSLFAIPPIIFYPLIILILGFDIESKSIMGAIVGSPPLFIYTLSALQSINWNLVKVGLIYTDSFLKILYKIIMPSIFPILLIGVRLAVSYCVVGVIFAEMTAGGDGLGFLISWSTTTLRISLTYSSVAVVFLFSALLYLATYGLSHLIIGGRRI